MYTEVFLTQNKAFKRRVYHQVFYSKAIALAAAKHLHDLLKSNDPKTSWEQITRRVNPKDSETPAQFLSDLPLAYWPTYYED